jgi:CheY-like chemotaxis protein
LRAAQETAGPLPLEAAPAAGAGIPAAATGDLIYVIEDNLSNLRLVRDLLVSRGYRVESSGSGEDALRALKFLDPRLILIDIQLPGMDGLQVARLLRATAGSRDVPILALTAHAMRGDEERAREAGCNAYLTKPFEAADLLSTVNDLLTPGWGRAAAGAGRH